MGEGEGEARWSVSCEKDAMTIETENDTIKGAQASGKWELRGGCYFE